MYGKVSVLQMLCEPTASPLSCISSPMGGTVWDWLPICRILKPGRSTVPNGLEDFAVFENVIKLADSFLDMGIPGYDIAIWKDGKCVLRHQNGYRDLEKTQKVDGTEKYDIYSCSKLITCTAAVQLWEQGKFRLEDKLSDYMPEFTEMTVQTEEGIVPAKNPIRIHHLFEMTAGFSYDTSSPAVKACREATDGRCPTREFMRYLAKEPLLFEPGDQYKYSLCHDVLAALVEVLAGEKFENYVQSHIFDPVGMKDSAFLARPICPKYRYNAETREFTQVSTNGYRVGTEYASGGAGAVSTVDDYIAFLEALRTGKLLKPETVKLMATDRLTAYQKRTFPMITTRGYGLGVNISYTGTPLDPASFPCHHICKMRVTSDISVAVIYLHHIT